MSPSHIDSRQFFILMGPNTVTGHLSVIYTVECQINFILRLLTPLLTSLPSYRSASYIPRLIASTPATVEVRPDAAQRDSEWTQREAKKLVWASGCTNWAVDKKTGMNNMMYPDWQVMFWLRSVFLKKADFVYKDEKSGKEVSPGEGMRWARRVVLTAMLVGGLVKREEIMGVLGRGLKELRGLDLRQLISGLRA
jgi:hypothetical protein